MTDCPSAAHGTPADPYGCHERELAITRRIDRAVDAALAPTGRRLADRLIAEGALLAQQYAGQDRLDPTRPALSVLVAEALAAAERRGEERTAAERDAYRDGLAALVDAVERVDRNSPNARYSATVIPAALLRARRFLDAGPS